MNCCLSICAVLIAGFSLAQPVFTFNQGGTSAKNYYEELPYESVNGKLFVHAGLGGKEYKFLFDTGAPMAISKELAATLNAAVVQRNLIKDVNGATDSASVIRLEHIQLGTLDFTGIPAVTYFPEFFKCLGIEGVVGSNLLRNSIVRIDSQRHVIVFTDQPGKLGLNKKHSVPLITNTSDQSDPIVRVTLNGKVTVDLGFDTGDNGFLRMPEELMHRLDQWKAYEILTTGYGASQMGEMGVEQNADKYRIRFPMLSIGDARFTNVVAETNKQGIPGLGSDLLNYGIVTLDFINGRFYMDAKTKVTDLQQKQWPFQPAFINEQLVVGVVWGAAVCDMQPGDQIVAINNTDFSAVTLCELIHSPSLLGENESAVLTIKDRQGNVKNCVIRRE